MRSVRRLRMLGTVRLEQDGQPLAGLESRKALALLCYLVSQGHPLPRAHLVDLFWGEYPEERGRGNLRRVLHNLTSCLPDWLTITRDTVQFQPSAEAWVDILAFEALVSQGQPTSLADAVALYQGEFLAGLYVDDCAEFEAWVVVERERWQQRVAEVLQRLMTLHTQQGAYEPARTWAERLLALDPWREEAHRELMRLLALSGQRSAALAQYEACARILADELGVEPSPDTIRLYEQIQSGALAPAVSRPTLPNNLPTPVTQFVGREEELAAVAERLASPACRLITLVGPGGVGKTRLSLEAGHRALASETAAETFPDGVFFVPLAAVTDPALVASTIAQTLELRTADGLSSLVRLKSFLRHKRLLLVLDNFEQVVTAGPQIADLLAHSAGLKVIVTTRTPLHIYGEHEFPVAPLALPDLAALPDVEGLLRYPIIQLFQQRAQAASPAFRLTPANGRAVAEICRRVDGLPLAVELAAAQVKRLPPHQLLLGLSSRLALLTDGPLDQPVRLQALHHTIAWSYQLLTHAEQTLFRRLAVFNGGFTTGAAEAVVAGGTLSLPDDAKASFPARLAALVEHSLLQRAALPNGELRYQMLETIREYALGQLGASGEEASLRRRHADYFMQWVEEAEPQLTGPETEVWLDRQERNRDNLWAVLAWAKATASASGTRPAAQAADEAIGPLTLGLRLGAALWRLWVFRGYLNEGRQWMEELLALVEESGEAVPLTVQAKAWHATGNIARNQGDYTGAGRLYETALALQRQTGHKPGICRSLHGVGNVAYNVSDYARATRYFEEALVLRQELGDTWGTALELQLLGEVAYCQGDLRRAASQLEAALALYQSRQDKWGVAMILDTLGVLAQLRGDYQRAATLLTNSRALHNELDYKRGIALNLGTQGNLALDQGQLDEAHRWLDESLRQCRTLGEKWGIAVALEYLSRLAFHQQRVDEALSYADESHALFLETGDRRCVARALLSLARAARLAHSDEAAAASGASLTLYAEIGDRWGIATALVEQAYQALAEEGDTAEKTLGAARCLGAAEALRTTMGYALPPIEQPAYDECLARLHALPYPVADAWHEGQLMSLAEAAGSNLRALCFLADQPMVH